MPRTLSAPITVAFDYTRSTGPVLGRFLTGLRDGQVIGGRTSDGTVVVPPPEYDPVTHQQIEDFVEVADTGTVTSWTWVPEPVKGQPLDRPFAFVLVTLDGADVPLLHALDVSSRGRRRDRPARQDPLARGAGRRHHRHRVLRARGDARPTAPQTVARETVDPVTGIIVPIELDYVYAASPEESLFYTSVAEGKLVGQRCPTCEKVYIPPRSACPADGTPTKEEVELSDSGTITTFCIVNVPFLGQRITPPYVSAYVLLDGADIALLHLILDIPADEVRMGMRVKAVWKPREEWGTTIENISHFAPTGEPDAEYDTYKQHL